MPKYRGSENIVRMFNYPKPVAKFIIDNGSEQGVVVETIPDSEGLLGLEPRTFEGVDEPPTIRLRLTGPRKSVYLVVGAAYDRLIYRNSPPEDQQ